MAKGKHSTALFEVIHAARRPAGRSRTPASRASSASLLRTPKWWFKNHAAGSDADAESAADHSAADPNDPTSNVTAATLNAPRARAKAGAEPGDLGDGPFLDPHTDDVSASPVVSVAAAAAPAAEPRSRDFSEPEPVLVAHADDVAVPAVSVAPAPAPKVAPVARVAPTAPPAPRRAPAGKTATGWFGTNKAAAAKPAAAKPAIDRAALADRAGVHWQVDRDRREVTLRMRYTSAIVAGFVVFCAVGLAYVVGRQSGEPPAEASAVAPAPTPAAVPTPSSKELKKGPVQQGALDPLRGNARQASAKIDGAGTTGARSADESGLYVDAPIGPDGSVRRDVNRNYVLIQRYPASMRDVALKTSAFLTQNGVPCTVTPETGSNWFRVVGTRGFQRHFLDSKEYQDYKKQILSLSEKFAGKGSFRQFDPMPFKWDGR